MNLNPVIDVPLRCEAEIAFRRACSQYDWLQIRKVGGIGTHTGQGTSWAGSYQSYELSDPLSPDWGMTGRVAEAANEIGAAIALAIGEARADKWW